MIHFGNTDMLEYDFSRLGVINISYKSCDELTKLLVNITTVKEQSLNVYERLFDLSYATTK